MSAPSPAGIRLLRSRNAAYSALTSASRSRSIDPLRAGIEKFGVRWKTIR